jgi:hypothetical protein
LNHFPKTSEISRKVGCLVGLCRNAGWCCSNSVFRICSTGTCVQWEEHGDRSLTFSRSLSCFQPNTFDSSITIPSRRKRLTPSL